MAISALMTGIFGSTATEKWAIKKENPNILNNDLKDQKKSLLQKEFK